MTLIFMALFPWFILVHTVFYNITSRPIIV